MSHERSANKTLFFKIVLTAFIYVNLYAILYFFLDAKFSCVFLVVSSWVITPAIFWLENLGRHRSARLFFLVACLLYIFATPLGIRFDLYAEFYYLSVLLLPAFLNDPNDRGLILSEMILCTALGFYSLWGTLPLLPPHWMPTEFPVETFRVLNFFGAMLLSALFLKFFVDRHRKSAAELDHFFNLALDLMCIADSKGVFRRLNPSFTRVLGYTDEELKSQPFIEFVHPDDVAKTLVEIEKLSKGITTINFENRYRCKDGSYRILNWSTSPDPRSGMLYASASDITLIREREKELEQIFRAIDTSAIVAMTDRAAKIISVNDNFCTISGYPRNELIGQDHRIINSGAHSKDFFKNLWSTINSGKVWSGEIQNKNKNGQPYFVQTVITPLLDVNGEIQRFLAIRFDVTQQKESERLFQQAQRAAKIGSWTYYPAIQKMVWSKQMYELFPEDPNLGAPSLEQHCSTIHPDDQELWKSSFEKSILTQKPCSLRFRSLFPDGHTLWIEGFGSPIFDAQGKFQSLSGTCKDITELVAAEEKAKLERAKALQNAKLASLGEMSAGIAHEINNPLAIITGATWVLQRMANDPEKVVAKLESINKAAERITKIVGGLRKFSRSSEKTEYRQNSISVIAQEAMILIGAKATRDQTPVKLDCQIEGAIFCNEIEIEQVFVNLINNGIDAVKKLEEKWVHLEITEDEKFVQVKITDSGKGIPQEIQNKLFQPFFTTKDVGEGTGLGLSIVKGIVDEHLGSIEVVNDLSHTCFLIKLPKVRSARDI